MFYLQLYSSVLKAEREAQKEKRRSLLFQQGVMSRVLWDRTYFFQKKQARIKFASIFLSACAKDITISLAESVGFPKKRTEEE